MKVLIFAGTHPRHLFFHKAVVDSGVNYFAVIMKRKDFKPIHLRVIYDLFENQIVDEYLSGNLDNDLPNLICGFN